MSTAGRLFSDIHVDRALFVVFIVETSLLNPSLSERLLSRTVGSSLSDLVVVSVTD